MPLTVQAIDHVGIRVTDRARSLAFYGELGFAPDPGFSTDRVAEIVSADGVRLNLIFNGEGRANNVLLDEVRLWPGYTHAAFIVPSLQDVIDWAEKRGVVITEGPHDWGRRLTCFLRDPDGNVLEFNELKA
ncbi:MAG TPA: VOC family protein [Sphingomicrobium sp.]|nr:VOC family protein [Sphingomicrobium sp.]